MPVKSLIFEAFLIGGTCSAIYCATVYLFDKIDQHDYEVENLSLLLKEFTKKHESSQDHELKK